VRFALALVLMLALAPALLNAPAAARRRPAPAPTPTPVPTSSPTPAPSPVPQGVRLERLRATLAAIAHAAPGRLGVAVVDLVDGTHIDERGDETFPLASVGKIAIALAAYRGADQHHLNLDRRVVQDGIPRSVAESIAGMLLGTDPAATRTMLAQVGGTRAVDALVARLGVSGVDLASGNATPNALAHLLDGIAQQRYTHLDSTNEFLQLLARVQGGAELFSAGAPPGSLAHEPGWSASVDGLTAATNDAGILTLRDGRRVVLVAMLANSRADLHARGAVFASIARAVYATYSP
jgi:beta-lactamase class A